MRPIKRPAQIGAATVEFAFVLVIMLLIMAGMVEFGRTFWYADALTKATRDGARVISSWPAATLSSQGLGAARTITKDSANAANVSPPLANGNVLVQCLNEAFNSVACADGTAPANVRVSIDGFTVNLGEWFPFIGSDGLISFGGIQLGPHTTMRYMN
ncbi:TadE/TadG family type IV pilus assembly protein [Rhodoferax sp.]|uniref:TadE/TadG family type IV pilus assembly protein n=1 Tax=Rhodoferax sp. TaxID=50421 RepID=UPI002604A2F9|nr:TadE/TadG family type IV pilus assembly protein [Rhodoferax sp.]MDD2918559.1 TadE/TadG family type IV pilus assembly protein [Rhodoferax sp.]